MATQHTLRETILIVMRKTPGVRLEELVRTCSACTWNQVFLEVDRLTRTGEVHLTKDDRFDYTLTVARPASPRAGRGRPVTEVSPSRRHIERTNKAINCQYTREDGRWVRNH